MPSYLDRFKQQNPRVSEFYSDDEILDFLPKYDPQEFGNLNPEQVRFKALDDRTAMRRGFSAGIDQLQAMGGGAIAMTGDAVGSDTVRDFGLDIYRRNMEEAALSAPETNFLDIDGVGDALNWAGYTLGNLAPMMATSIAGGGAGGILANQAVKKSAAAMTAKLVADGMSKQAAAQEVGKFVAKRIALGQALGAGTASIGMESGNIYGETEDAAVSAVHGAIAGSIDALPIMRIFSRFGADRAAKDALETSVIRELGKQGIAEATTEGIQTFVEQHAKYWVENEGRSLLGNIEDVDWGEIVEASAAGALGGGFMGAGASVANQEPMFFRRPQAKAGEDDLDRAINRGEQAAQDTRSRGGDSLDAELARAQSQAADVPAAVLSARQRAQELFGDPVAAPDKPQTIPGQIPDFPTTQRPDVPQTIAGQWNQPTEAQPETIALDPTVSELIASARGSNLEDQIPRLEAANRMLSASQRFEQQGVSDRAQVMRQRAQAIMDDVRGRIPESPAQGQPEIDGREPIATWTGRRGDGYATIDAAEAGLRTRERVRKDLDWRIERMPSGRYQLSGYAQEREARGTLARPDTEAIEQLQASRQEGEQERQSQIPPERRQMQGAAIDRIIRNIERRNGAATQAEADQLAEYGMGRPFDRIVDETPAPEGVMVSSSGEPFADENAARKSLPYRRNPGATVVPVGNGFGVQLPEPIREPSPEDQRIKRLQSIRQEYEAAYDRGALNETLAAVEKANAEIDAFAKESFEAGTAPFYRSTAGDMYFSVTPSTRQPGKYQITTFNDTGALGDTVVNSLDEVHKEINGAHADPVPAAEAEQIMARLAAAETEYQQRRAAFEQSRAAPAAEPEPDPAPKPEPQTAQAISSVDQADLERRAAEKQRQDKLAKRRRVDTENDTIVRAAIKLGGIKPQWKEDITGDIKGNTNVPGVGFLFTDRGTSIDDMATKLHEAGYIPDSEMQNLGGVPWLNERLGNELAGRGKTYSLSSSKAVDEILAARDEQMEIEREMLASQREAEYAAIEAEYGPEAAELARQYDEDMDNINEDLSSEADYYEQQLQQREETAQARLEESLTDAQAAARDEQLRQADDQESREPSGSGGSTQTSPGAARPDLTLTPQTESERQQSEQSQAAAARQSEREQSRAARDAQRESDARNDRARATATVDGFDLGKSAEEQLAGVDDLFSQPQRQPPSNDNATDQTASQEAVSVSGRQKKKPSEYGQNNKLVTKDRAEELRKKLRDKLRNQLNSGIDPEMLAMGAELAAFHIEAGARKFADFAAAIADDLGVTPADLKKYLRSWYNGARDMMEDSDIDVSGMDSPDSVRNQLDSITGDNANDQRAAADTTANSQEGQQRDPETDLVDGERGSGRSENDAPGTATDSNERGSGSALGERGASTDRKPVNRPVRSEKSRLEADAARDTDSSGSLPGSTGGLFADRETGSDVSSVASKAPATKPVIPADSPKTVTLAKLSEIQKQMPFLTEGQAADVAFAEKRLSKPDGFGVLFTNGTGTGKTFSGLGVAKRSDMAGKSNILILAPKQPIADAWIKAGKQFFGLNINRLQDTNDAGEGIVVTTFANAGDNDALMNREWDLIIADEAHYLSSAGDGKTTKALDKIRALTLKRNTATDRVYSQNRKKVEEMQEFYSTAEIYRKSDNEQLWHKADEIRDRADTIRKELDALIDKERERIKAIPDKDKPRAVFLSATPFAYEKNVQWANEFLFDWGVDDDGSGYNSGNNYEKFMMAHFGYRMRYNKLTEPDAKVDRGLMQRAFNSWLKKEGALSARALDSDYDYDRLFVYADNQIGRRVDEAIDWLRERSSGENEVEGMREVYDELIKDKFDYHTRMYFLEAIKAREALPQIKGHIALGRKVLVMHDFLKGGVSNPFKLDTRGTSGEISSAYNKFASQFRDLINAFDYIPSPIALLTREFPSALVYNGRASAKNRIQMQNQFNSDEPGSPMLMIAQGDAMREGVSIHDTSGKHQRVLIHLGMPTKPTAAIQQEGRIFRTGQASDAMFRYLTIGSNWERYAFASRIATRASAAENLAMGEQARGLKEAFISAYENADEYPPGFDGEGRGGKKRDAAYANALTPWDMAKSYYFGSKKYQSGRSARGRENSEFYATPDPLGMKMVQWADIRPGESVLEPSAGLGAIARWFPENSENRAIEFSNDLASRLALHFDGDLMTGDFMDHHIVNKYDAIVMNPPFGNGGKQAADHVAKAIRHLRDRGRIVALIPTGPAADKQFDKLLYDNPETEDVITVADIALPRVTFERAGTAVTSRIIVLEKQSDPEVRPNMISVNRDYSSAESIEELFDLIESDELSPRTIPEETTPEGTPVSVNAETGFETWEAEHSKTGEKLYMARPTEKLSREDYKRVAEAAKSFGGYWSRFGKPGFLFKSDENRNSFVAAGNGEGAVFSRGSRGQVSIPIDRATALAKAITSRFQNAPDVIVVQSMQDQQVPEAVRREDAKQRSQGASGDPEGFYFQGKAYIVLDGLTKRSGETDAQALFRVFSHEVLGHAGLRGLFRSDLTKVLNEVAIKRRDDMLRKTKEYGLKLSDQTDRMIAAEEVLAEMAQTNPTNSLVARAVEAIRQALRKMFSLLPRNVQDSLGNNAFADWITGMSDAEIIDRFIVPAREYIRGGQADPAGDAVPAFQRRESSDNIRPMATNERGDRSSTTPAPERSVEGEKYSSIPWFHGTDAEFDSFDMSMAGQNFNDASSPEGIFLAAQEGNARLYGDRSIKVGVDFRNPMVVDAEALVRDEFEYLSRRGEFNGNFDAFISEYLEDDPYGFYETGQLNSDIKTAKRLGHDGLVVDFGSMKMDRGGMFAVAFDADQVSIQSPNQSPRNEGADSGIRFSRSDSTGFAIPDETLASVAISKIQDKFKILKDLQASIKQSGGTITEKNNAYIAEELFHGKAENDIRQMQEQYVEPLADKMAKFDISRDQLDEYLYARHAKERNAYIATINPDMPDGGSGMTNQAAREILAKVRDSGNQDKYDQLAAIVYDMLAVQRDLIKQGGLESDATIDAWQEQYENYVPLKGWAEDTKQEAMPRTGKGFSVSGRESKQAMGRSSQAASPTSYAINDLTEKLIRRRKNEVGNAFLALVKDNPNPDYWQVFTDENPEKQRTVKMVKDPDTGEMVQRVTETAIPMAMLTDRYFTTKKNGKTFYIKLEDPRLMKAMKNIGPESNGTLIRTLSGITRVMSSLNTSYSPEFMVSNFARDVQTALLNLQAEQSLDPEVGKAAGTKIAKKTMKDIPKAMRAIYGSLRGTEPTSADSKKWHALFDQFRADGAKTGWFDMKDLDGQSKNLDSMVAMAKGGFKGKALKFARDSAELVENMNQAVENAVRLAAYANAIDAGISRTQAASLAKNMTVNFNRRGEIGTTLNALYMFANASIQGTANFVRTMGTLKGDGRLRWRNMNNAQKVAFGMMAGAYFIGYANRMAAGEDEDDENWYDKVPDYVKERNIVLMKSLFGGPQDGSYWKIPLPYGYNIFSVMGTSMEAVLGGGKPVTQASADIALAAMGSFSPIGFQDSQTSMGMFLKNAAPTLIKPAVEIGLNENFMGSSIYTENLPFGTPRPESALARQSTPEAYKKLAQWMNEVTGGSEYRSGAVDVNPDVMQHFLDYFGGSAYAFFGSKVPDAIHRAAAGVTTEQNRVPFLSRVSGQVLPYADTEKFYRRRDEINQAYDEYRALPAELRANFEGRELIRMRPLLRATERQLSKLRERRDRIYSADLSLKERDPKLKEIELSMKEVVDRFNRRYNAISD